MFSCKNYFHIKMDSSSFPFLMAFPLAWKTRDKSNTQGYAHGTGDHLRHIVCIVCLDRFSRKKTIGSF